MTKHSPLFKQMELKLFGHGAKEEGRTFSTIGALEENIVVVFAIEVLAVVCAAVVVMVVINEDVLVEIFISLLLFLILQNGPLIKYKNLKINLISYIRLFLTTINYH
jgi:hypothetical protein